MSRINVLDTVTANAIKAGEVIERPSSIVKELVDNAIDAGATKISVSFEDGGITYINVTDNGIGMDKEDAEKCFLIHATSKIKTIEDVYSLTTQGFRGEALASICACADVILETRQADSEYGTRVEFTDGLMVDSSEVACDIGTSVSVNRIFANIPARFKFLKKDATEGMYITHLIERLSVVNPHISFKLYKDGKLIITTPGNGDMLDTIYSVYGKEIATNIVEVNYEYEGLKIRGYCGKPSYVKASRSHQVFYVNERNIKNTVLTSALDEAYRNLVMKGKFPICYLCIYIPSSLVDVNVHPQKLDVRFNNESDVFRLVYHGVKNAVLNTNESIDMSLGSVKEESVSVAPVKPQLSFDTSAINSVIPTTTIPRQSNYVLDQFKDNESSESKSSNSGSFEPKSTAEEVKAYTDILSSLSSMPVVKTEEAKINSDTKIDETPVIPAFTIEDAPKSDFEELLSSDFVGFVFNTYIIMQSSKHMFLIDQHAAHERVLYEKFLEKYSSNDNTLAKQTLIVPKVLSLGQSDLNFVVENSTMFDSYGFEIEQIGDREVAIRTVPFEGNNVDVGKAVENIIASAKNELPTGDNAWFSLIATKACKAAIKGNQRIDREEALELLKLMRNLKDPYHCPHGRPTFIKLSQQDLEKEFKRIV